MPLQEWFALFFSWLFSPARQENLTFLDVAAALAASSGRVQSGHDFRRQVGSLLRVDLGPMLVNVGCPTLVLHGDSDLLIPSEAGRSLAAGITGAEFRALAGVGHLAQAESAERVCAAIEGFVPAGACAPAQDPG
jgi:pimeloyl-ACP methyl ester carboxylesterase